MQNIYKYVNKVKNTYNFPRRTFTNFTFVSIQSLSVKPYLNPDLNFQHDAVVKYQYCLMHLNLYILD